MNTPIINPLWIYFANVLPNFGIGCLVIGTVGLIALVIIAVALMNDYGWSDDDDEDFINMKKTIKKYLHIPIILILIGTLIPSQKTIYGMMAASYTTPANIEAVGEGTKEAIDYIFEKIDAMKENENESN